jgi:hypothetical protein
LDGEILETNPGLFKDITLVGYKLEADKQATFSLYSRSPIAVGTISRSIQSWDTEKTEFTNFFTNHGWVISPEENNIIATSPAHFKKRPIRKIK